MPDSLVLYIAFPFGVVAIIVSVVYVVKRQRHKELVTRIDKELNEAAGVEEGGDRNMQAPTDDEKAAAEREMWEDEMN